MSRRKYQLVIAKEDPEEDRLIIEDWLNRNANLISENMGCGCCVDIWEFEGEEDIVGELPEKYVSAVNG